MNPHISIPRQHGGTPNFGGTPPSTRNEGLRMPRFFKRWGFPSAILVDGKNWGRTKENRIADEWENSRRTGRLFKFPQMDFEMAIWEMTSLLFAPKKVFRSIYYHVCTSSPLSPSFAFCPIRSPSWSPSIQKRKQLSGRHPVAPFNARHRNEKHLAQARPLLHLPPCLLHAPYRYRMGHCIHPIHCYYCAANSPLRIRSLSCQLAPRRHRCVLPRWEVLRSGNCGLARKEATTGFIYEQRGGRATWVWLLFRCLWSPFLYPSGYRGKPTKWN